MSTVSRDQSYICYYNSYSGTGGYSSSGKVGFDVGTNNIYHAMGYVELSKFYPQSNADLWRTCTNRKLKFTISSGAYTKREGSSTSVIDSAKAKISIYFSNSTPGTYATGTLVKSETVNFSGSNEFDISGYLSLMSSYKYVVFEVDHYTDYSGGNGVYYGMNVYNPYLNLTYDQCYPDVKASSPIDGASVAKSSSTTFKWSFSESGDMNFGQKRFVLSVTNNGNTQTIDRISQNQYYTFPAYSFVEGDLTWNVAAYGNTAYTGYSGSSGVQSAIVEPSIPKATPTYPVNENIYKSQPFTLTWKFEETGSTGQKSWSVEIGQNEDYETYSGVGDDSSLQFPGYKFVDGQVAYRITVTNNDDQTTTSKWYYFTIIPSVPIITGVYPIDVLVKKSKDCTFAWNYSEEPAVGQIKYWITYTQNGQRNVIENESSNHYHTFTSNTLVNGPCTYSIKVLNYDGQYGECGPFTFTVVGDSDAPDITDVSQDAMPLIEWTLDSQDAYEVVIKDNNDKVVYESGLVVDPNARSHKVDKLILNGAYYVYVRALNIYGYYTDYGSFYLQLNAECQSDISGVYAFETAEYGVSIDCEYTGGKAYVIRRKANAYDDTPEVIGEWHEGFVDYTIPGNTAYQYAIRLYDVGVADSSWAMAKVDLDEVIIRDSADKSNYVMVWMSTKKDFSVLMSKTRSKTLTNCIGRTYPIKEVGEWITSTVSISAYVSNSDFDRLVKMSINSDSVGIQTDKEYLLCDMTVEDGGVYVDGRLAEIRLTQIDEG